MTNNSTYLQILASREDISNYMFHFAKWSRAKDTLQRIIECEAIKDINERGYICFTEANITMLSEMFKIFDRWNDPMYAPYGIGIERRYFIEHLGGKPAIYGDLEDKKRICPRLWWRFVDFNPKDFTWLREWRVPSNEIILDSKHFIVITKRQDEFKEMLYDGVGSISVETDFSDGQFHTSYIGQEMYKLKGVSLEEIDKTNHLSKAEFQQLIDSKDLEQTVFLGS